jgi:predicted HD phosphohydrolase
MPRSVAASCEKLMTSACHGVCHQVFMARLQHRNMPQPQDILDLWARKGAMAYDGEGISQLEHAWQCGQLALAAGAPPALQLASWLHDVGHLLTDLSGTPTLQGVDDRHEHSGAHLLEGIWGCAVAEPVRLHVAAKRFMVARNPRYLEQLSIDSVRSLTLQGGPMKAAECAAFASGRHAQGALQLRAWDDAGKRPAWFASYPQQALEELGVLMARVPCLARKN